MPDLQSPITTVQDAVAYITSVQNPIASRGGSADDPAQFWQGMDLDALILSAPDHMGRPQEIAREVYHRLVARFVGSNAIGIQRSAQAKAMLGALAGALLVSVLSGGAGVSLMPSPMSMYGGGGGGGSELPKILFFLAWLGTPIALFFYAQYIRSSAAGWMCTPQQLEQYKKDAEGAVRRCFLRGFPPDTPADLADVWRHGWITSDGRPVSSEIVETDATSLVALEVAQGWRSVYRTVLILAGLSLTVCCPLFIIPFLFLIGMRSQMNPGQLRAMELDRRQAVEGPLLVSAGGIEWAMHQEQAWMKQIVEARKDTTPVLHLGDATGILAGRGDFYAPSAGLPFNLSLRDLQNHLVVLGGTGSGKTSGVLRPLAHQIAAMRGVGLVVMDGKAALPYELRNLSGMKIVDPASSTFSLVAGLSPAEIVDTLSDVLGGETSGDSSYWADSAKGLLRRAGVIGKHAGGEWWTLQGIMRIAAVDEDLLAAKACFPVERALEDPLLEEALLYFGDEWRMMDAKPKSSIISHARSWVSVITAHPELLAWAATGGGKDTFDLLAPLQGGRIGFLIPAHRYGHAGAAVTALLKARMYAALKNRAERTLDAKETPVVFIIDEAQEVATRDDATMLSIGRSLGLAMVGATQTIEGVTEKLGEQAAAKWLAVYGNAIALPGRSKATDAFIADRAGAAWRARVTGVPGISVRDSITAAIFTGSVASARRQVSMRPFASPAPSPIASFMQNSQNAAVNKQQVSADPRMNREGDNGVTSSLSPHPLIVPEEVSTLLAEPNLALVVTTRARVPRRDVVMLKPRFD
jgi:TraM recognition site of TraD and TraG